MASTQPSRRSQAGRLLAKVLGIKLQYRDPLGLEGVTRGESTFSAGTANTYVEEEPTTLEWLLELTPDGQQVSSYFWNLFPFLRWIGRYNVQWLLGDLVAG